MYEILQDVLFQTLYNLKSTPFVQGFIDKFFIENLYTKRGRQHCFNYMIFAGDIEVALNKLNFQLTSKVVLIWTMSRWHLNEFFTSEAARAIQNLLVISDPILRRDYQV